MRLIEDLGMCRPTPLSKKAVRMGIYECALCLTHFTAATNGAIRDKREHCKDCSYKIAAKKRIKHGESYSRLYIIWADMKQRCNNINNRFYSDYGGRGIYVTAEWHSFTPFKEWAEISGYKETLTIDRINVDKGYTPDNCRWATASEQAINTRVIRSTNTSGFRGVTYDSSRKAI